MGIHICRHKLDKRIGRGDSAGATQQQPLTRLLPTYLPIYQACHPARQPIHLDCSLKMTLPNHPGQLPLYSCISIINLQRAKCGNMTFLCFLHHSTCITTPRQPPKLTKHENIRQMLTSTRKHQSQSLFAFISNTPSQLNLTAEPFSQGHDRSRSRQHLTFDAWIAW